MLINEKKIQIVVDRYFQSECDVNTSIRQAFEKGFRLGLLYMALKKGQSTDRPTGEWKIDEYGIHHCPICHAINNTVYKSFCPNCGAKMDKKD